MYVLDCWLWMYMILIYSASLSRGTSKPSDFLLCASASPLSGLKKKAARFMHSRLNANRKELLGVPKSPSRLMICFRQTKQYTMCIYIYRQFLQFTLGWISSFVISLEQTEKDIFLFLDAVYFSPAAYSWFCLPHKGQFRFIVPKNSYPFWRDAVVVFWWRDMFGYPIIKIIWKSRLYNIHITSGINEWIWGCLISRWIINRGRCT